MPTTEGTSLPQLLCCCSDEGKWCVYNRAELGEFAQDKKFVPPLFVSRLGNGCFSTNAVAFQLSPTGEKDTTDNSCNVAREVSEALEHPGAPSL